MTTEYVVQGLYVEEAGWDDLTYHDTRADAIESRRTYNDNERDVPHRVVRRTTKEEK